MHIQISETMFAALTTSQLGYVMEQRGEVEIKVSEDGDFLDCFWRATMCC